MKQIHQKQAIPSLINELYLLFDEQIQTEQIDFKYNKEIDVIIWYICQKITYNNVPAVEADNSVPLGHIDLAEVSLFSAILGYSIENNQIKTNMRADNRKIFINQPASCFHFLQQD